MAVKLYKSRVWLTRKYVKERKGVDEIAAMSGASKRTIYNQLKEFGLLKKS